MQNEKCFEEEACYDKLQKKNCFSKALQAAQIENQDKEET
jgi:hypothetical protein